MVRIILHMLVDSTQRVIYKLKKKKALALTDINLCLKLYLTAAPR